MVRELTGGIYFGDRGRRNSKHGREAYDTEAYSVMEIERIARAAFDAAMKRRKKLISIDKANVLETSRLWRETVHRIAAEYPEVELSDMLVDNAAMMLRYSFDLMEEADCIENAVNSALNDGCRTADILGRSNAEPLSSTEMAQAVLDRL